jgi:hypothetical protein
MIKDVAFSRKSALQLKLRTLIAMYANFIPISAVESFVLFPFTWDYLNLEIFKIFYLLGFGIFTGFGHFQTSETSGRNMAVELDSRHPLLLKTGWENEDLTLILRGKKGHFCRYKCFQC